ncbi:MarR family transcriptional regulator [Micromonospora sp. 4G55]|nr:MarR family transcriptional regulator [Micromonospora sp. 4G55]
MASPSRHRAEAARWLTASQVLATLHRRPGITRAAMAAELQLTSGFATEITARLRELRLLTETPAPTRGRAGPRPSCDRTPRGRWYSPSTCGRRTGDTPSRPSTGSCTRCGVVPTAPASRPPCWPPYGRASRRPGTGTARACARYRWRSPALSMTDTSYRPPPSAGARSTSPPSPPAQTCRCCSATTRPSPASPRPAPAPPSRPAPPCT